MQQGMLSLPRPTGHPAICLRVASADRFPSGEKVGARQEITHVRRDMRRSPGF